MSYKVIYKTYNSRKAARQAWRRAKLGEDYVVRADGNGKWKIARSTLSHLDPETHAAFVRIIVELLNLVWRDESARPFIGRRCRSA